MKKLTKGIGLFILALFMVFGSFSTTVEAEATSDLTITYYTLNTSTGKRNIIKQYDYNMSQGDLSLTGKYWYEILVNRDFTTSNSLLLPGNCQYIVEAGNHTITYTGDNKDYTASGRTNTLNALFRMNNGYSGDNLTLNGGIYNVTGEVEPKLVDNHLYGTTWGKYTRVYMNGVTVNFTNAQATSLNGGIMCGVISLDNTKIIGANQSNFIAVKPVSGLGTTTNCTSVDIKDSTIKGFSVGLDLQHASDRNTLGANANLAGVKLSGNVVFEDNGIDIKRNGKALYFDDTYTGTGLAENTSIKIYDYDSVRNGNIVTGISENIANLKITPVNTNINYSLYTNPNDNTKKHWIVGKWDASKATYTTENGADNDTDNVKEGTIKASYLNTFNYTLKMSATDSIVNSEDAAEYTGLNVANNIPGTYWTHSYAKKSDSTYTNVANAQDLASSTKASLVPGDYKVTLKLYDSSTKTLKATMTKTFSIVNNFKEEGATYSVENNMIKITESGAEGKSVRYVSISAPDKEYDGKAYNNSTPAEGTEYTISWTDGQETKTTTLVARLSYANEDGTSLTSAPTNAGSYKVTLKLYKKDGDSQETEVKGSGDSEVSVYDTFKITPAENDGSDDGLVNDFDTSDYTITASDEGVKAVDKNGNELLLSMDPEDGEYNGNGYDESLLNIVDGGLTDILGGSYKVSYLGVNGTSYGPSTAAPSGMGSYQVTLTYTAKDGKTYKIVKTFKIGPSSDDSLNDKYCKSTKGSNYAWSKEKQACVYKVTNTGSN